MLGLGGAVLGSLMAVWKALTLNAGFNLPLLSIKVEGRVEDRWEALEGKDRDLDKWVGLGYN